MSALDLSQFLPYRLSVLANKMSAQLATVYAERFNISIPEWRVIAVLGQFDGVSADFVGGKTEMDRVTVSRAVAKLLKKRYIKRRFQISDRRCSVLSLAAAGKHVYADVVPLAKQYEDALTVVFDPTTFAQFNAGIDRLQAQLAAVEGDLF
ncbi:MAG: MarR family transcriptional regulator [Gammaproteobacteria bacterium]|nr:MarR family transcriptional regulator [Gammaproteobacteria bacterium]